MSLSFSTLQIQTMSKDLLLLPGIINAPKTGLVDQKAAYAALAPPLLATDQNQQVFSDAWIATVNAYHAELAAMNSELRTNYDGANIVTSAHSVKADGTHFPTAAPMWANLTPKLIPSSTGLPHSVNPGTDEITAIADIEAQPPLFTTGFNDGSNTATGTLSGNVITATSSIAGFTAGNRLYMNVGGVAVFTTITSVTTAPDTVHIAYSGSGAVNFQNFFPGFTNSQRSGTSSLGAYAPAYASLRDQFKASVVVWQTDLNTEKTALLANQDLNNGAHVTTALTNVNAALASIATWQALPDLTVNGLLTDSALATLQTAMTTRSGQITARVTQIGTDLGSVSQNTDGTYSGAGAYLELFKIVDQRCSIGTGTLTKYYDNIRNQGFFDKQISSASNQITQYQGIMIVSQVLADTIVGQDTFAVDSVAGLSVSDSVLVMDNGSIVYSRTISQITGTNVRLNTGIPIVLTAANLARIVKMK